MTPFATGLSDSVASRLRSRLCRQRLCPRALLAGGLYLGLTGKKYVAVSKVLVERLSVKDQVASDAVLTAQADVLRSSEVLRLADSKAMLGDLPTFKGVRGPRRPARTSVRSEGGGSSSVLTVTYPAARAKTTPSKSSMPSSTPTKAISSDVDAEEAAKLSQQVGQDRKTILDQLSAARRCSRITTSRPAGLATPAERLNTVSSASTQSTLDTLATKRRYDDAVAAAGSALTSLNDEQLETAMRDAAAFAPDSSEIIEQEARMLESQLAVAAQDLRGEPSFAVRTTARLRQVRVVQVASMRSRRQAAQ